MDLCARGMDLRLEESDAVVARTDGAALTRIPLGSGGDDQPRPGAEGMGRFPGSGDGDGEIVTWERDE